MGDGDRRLLVKGSETNVSARQTYVDAISEVGVTSLHALLVFLFLDLCYRGDCGDEKRDAGWKQELHLD
jgi:hypothetical protein